MKTFKIILVIVIISMLAFGGYKAYGLYKQWDAKRYNEIEILRKNQNMFLQKITDLSITITKVVNDVAKTTTTPKADNTYVELKDKVLELKKDEEANKEEIARLREELSTQRKAFLASDDTILIKTVDDETILLYRDESGMLQPASEGIEKIIEHKELSEVVPILAEEEIAINKARLKLKAGGYYSFDNSYGIIISKGIISIKDYSLNVSLLINDFEDFKFIAGGDVSYEVRDNIELAFGYNTEKEFYGALRFSF